MARRKLPLAADVASGSSDRVREGPGLPPLTARISLTDRCDLACVYCRPSRNDGYLEDRLDEAAFRSMVRGLLQAGIQRVRITGGEPLVHPHAVERVAFVASLGFKDIALTTNGTRLEALAGALRAAGLHRLTVSLDSLDAERFRRITRGGRLDRVLSGVDAAVRAGFAELKTNTVVLRGENDDELPRIVEWAWSRGIVPRFIELMRVGEGARLPLERLVPAHEMRAYLKDWLSDEPWRADAGRGPARYVPARHDPRLRAGFITGTTDTYCDSCDRLRVSADGTVRPCLAKDDGVAAAALASQGDARGVAIAVADAWSQKPDGRTWKGCTEATAAQVSMRAVGG
jgi:GTP 3',8-cyclase